MGVKDVFPQRALKIICIIEDDGKRAYGLTIYGEDDLGNRFIFAHLDWHSVAVGDIVKPWETFAGMGETGYCKSGAHLHWGMFLPGSDLGDLRGVNAVDPTRYMEAYGLPCNTEVTNHFGSDVYNKSKDSSLHHHEGVDFSSWRIRHGV